MHDSRAIHVLYRKLLTFYPREFKERVAESMEQTVNDLYREKEQSKSNLLSFVLWAFIETAIGIFREYRLLILEGDHMQTLLTNFRLPAFISFLSFHS